MALQTITPQALQELRKQGQAVDLVDVRTAGEYAQAHAEGARLVPLDQVDAASVGNGSADGDRPVYIICRSGHRSRTACERLQRAGMANVVNVQGGTNAWVSAGLPVERAAACATGGLRPMVRRAGLLLALLLAVLGIWHLWFMFAAGGVWLAMIVAGGGACPLCPTPEQSGKDQ